VGIAKKKTLPAEFRWGTAGKLRQGESLGRSRREARVLGRRTRQRKRGGSGKKGRKDLGVSNLFGRSVQLRGQSPFLFSLREKKSTTETGKESGKDLKEQ